jgi:hypothetical protein
MEKSEYYLLRKGKRASVMPIRMLDSPELLKILANPLGWKIYKELGEPGCPMDIAKKIGVHEQKVYYYINKFRKAGLVKETGTEARHGTVAKFYQIRDSAFGMKLEGAKAMEKFNIDQPVHTRHLEPFAVNGRLKARIIVGSPDPHGPFKARASDSCCAIDFALFFGAFTDGKNIPNYKLDTEIRPKDLRGNLILIGGPTVNMITGKLNDKLPVYIDLKNDVKVVSRISDRDYGDDECGLIAVVENPWDKKSKILVLAGKRFAGTRATVLAFVRHLEKAMAGNKFDRKVMARVVKGYDLDGDGIIDDAEFLE